MMKEKGIPQTLYHYTRFENLQNIIRQSEYGAELVFWLTHFRHMDDPSEGKVLEDTIRYVIPDFNLRNIPDVYILSLCGNVDNLPMWREYADNAQGIAIALDRDAIENNSKDVCRTILKCEYDKGNTLRTIKESLIVTNEKFEDGTWIEEESRVANFDRFPELRGRSENKSILRYLDIKQYFKELIAFKDRHYYENEYRLPIDGYYAERNKTRVKGKRMIEYREYHVDINALAGIYIGPNNTDEAKNSIKRYVKNLSLSHHIEIERIDIPYRTID